MDGTYPHPYQEDVARHLGQEQSEPIDPWPLLREIHRRLEGDKDERDYFIWLRDTLRGVFDSESICQ